MDPPSCQFLQTRLDIKKGTTTNSDVWTSNDEARVRDGICAANLAQKELSQPILQVADNFDQDGFLRLWIHARVL